MVNVAAKPIVKRTAVAAGKIWLAPATIEAIRDERMPKGDVLTVAKIAGITAAKQTGHTIPLCHTVILDQVDVEFQVADDHIQIQATAICAGRTGVEMEALSAVCGAALGIYDMCKAVDKQMSIGEIKLLEKTKTPIEES